MYSYKRLRLLKLDQLKAMTRKEEEKNKSKNFQDDPDFKVFSHMGLKTVSVVVI